MEVEVIVDPFSSCPRARIAFCAHFMNAGSTARGVELAKAFSCDVRFFSHRMADGSSSYEDLVRDAGFRVHHFAICGREGDDDVDQEETEPVDDALWHAVMEAERSGSGGYLPPPYESLARPYLRAVIETLRLYNPTIVVHGLFPEVSVARAILGIPSICYGPIPFNATWRRRNLVSLDNHCAGGTGRKHTAPTCFSMYQAALDYGWEGGGPMEMLEADEYLVCDSRDNYDGQDLCKNTHVIGPVFTGSSHPSTDKKIGYMLPSIPSDVEVILSRTPRPGQPKVLVTMASSGGREHLLEAIKACISGEYLAVIAAPRKICSIQNIKDSLEGKDLPDSIVMIDAFLPYCNIIPRVDIVICHGGQGTIQSIVCAGKPLVGLALQREQFFNLKNIERRRCGICMKKKQWFAAEIKDNVRKVLECPKYQEAADTVKDEMSKLNGPQKGSSIIFESLKRHLEL